MTDEVTALRRALPRGPVAVRAIATVAAALAAAADAATGRNAMPGVDQLVTVTGYGETTVQKSLRVLEQRGWLHQVRAGKNRLSLDDRLALWASDSPARQQRAVWACTIPPHARYAAGPVDNPPSSTAAEPRSAPNAGRGCALPTTRRVERVSPVPANKNFSTETASRTDPAGRPPTTEATSEPTHRTYRADPRTVGLAKALRDRVPWLRHVPLPRITAPLHRFAIAGWTAADVQDQMDRLLADRGWTVPGRPAEVRTDRAGRRYLHPASTMRSPYGYLAFLLRHLEPADLIADREYAAAQAATRARYTALRLSGPECPHRMPAGHLPDPVTGLPACSPCRRSSTTHGHGSD